MEDMDIINLWKSYDKKLDENLSVNKKVVEDVTKLKVRSFLLSMRPVKIFTIGVGIVWVICIDLLLITLYNFANPFFLISAGIQVLLTKIAIGIYCYQLILIQQVDVDHPLLVTQDKLARLKSTTLWIPRILFLQLPVWTTFFWSKAMFENVSIRLYLLPPAITLVFICIAVWLFRNIKYENRDKKWFKLIFDGREWNPVMKSQELLTQIDEYKDEPKR